MTKEQQDNPHISVVSQYIKDLSLENPDAPNSLAKPEKQPKVDISLDLNITKIKDQENTYEVTLMTEASAKTEEHTMFVVELSYAGIFTLEDIPQDQHEIVLAVHCPNMIFPFARKIISDVTQDSGYQPLRIDPIDFARLYQNKIEQQKSQDKAN